MSEVKASTNPFNPNNWGRSVGNILLAIMTFLLSSMYNEFRSQGDVQHDILKTLSGLVERISDNEHDIESHNEDIKYLYRRSKSVE